MSRKKKNEGWGENGFEDWGGYMAAKQAKLEEQFLNEANNESRTTNIFKGIAIFVNGYTDPTADELRRLMMIHGGVYHHYLRPKATSHIIASNLPYSKIVQYRKSQNPIPICKPEWITDSIKAGRILSFQNYLLYSQCTDVQPQLKYTIQNKKSRTNATSPGNEYMQNNDQVDSPKDDSNSKVDIVKHIFTTASTSDPVELIGSRNALSSKNSEFISEFYSHSRLHHLSTMGTTFKDYVNELRDKNNGELPGLIRLKQLRDRKGNVSLSDSQLSFTTEPLDIQENKMEVNQNTIIMHIDMDCFFVSVGLRDRPELRGLPVAVTHAKGNRNPANNNKQSSDNNEEGHGSLSEVASCSYEARKVGVRNGMFLGEALKICPDLKTIPYNFEGYTEVSYILYDTVAFYTLDIEAVSCDEMYADCTKILEECCLTPLQFATIIRKEIREKTGCPVSTGFGSNKLLARLATKKAKPNGQFYLQQEYTNDCISTLNVQDLPGVGWTTTHKLNGINVRTCAELQTISLITLQKEFGKKMGEMLYNMCRGIDNSKLNLEHVRKSVSADVNYGIRFDNNDDAIDFLKKLSVEVCNRLHKANAKGRCITLKVLVRAKEAPKETEKFMGHGRCDYMTKSKNLIASISDVDIVTKEVIALWNQMQKVPEDARGIGIQISRLDILKNKSRDKTLTSFIGKSKQSSTVQRSIETNNSNEAHAAASASEPIVANKEPEMQPRSNINESILSELPEEIRNEILNMNQSRKSVEDKKSHEIVNTERIDRSRVPKSVQTRPEDFFKQTKSGISRPTKVEMPPIQEVDMSVLIELPADIRNEILNVYSTNKRADGANTNTAEANVHTSSTDTASAAEMNRDEPNISFSQVDPEFLAALSEDLRRDVQMYCAARKTEQCSRSRNCGSIKNENVKQSRKAEQNLKVKNDGKNCKGTTLSKSKRKNVQSLFKGRKHTNESGNITDSKKNNGVAQSIACCVGKIESINDRITADEAEVILSHNRTISEDSGVNERQDMLIDLVNRLLNLPLEQVKVQIQMWITNSKLVNEVDFLSLATFLSMLPEKRRIEDLHVLLKTMHRCMTKTGNCIWHRTYRKTVKYVQHYMQIEYNSNLMVPPIKCNLLQCNSDVML